MNNDMDAQFLCKDCARFNQCQYYDRRKGDSYICKYFHLTDTCEMTNGEVLKVLFPNVGTNFSNVIDLNLWWNAPYKKGGEEE